MLVRTVVSTIIVAILTTANSRSLTRDRGTLSANYLHTARQINGYSSQTRQNVNCTTQIDPNLQHLMSRNITALSKKEGILLDKYLTEEPCYEFFPRFSGGRQIPYSMLYRTLALAFDWIINVWIQGTRKEYAIPPNRYGLEIRMGHIRQLRDRPLPLESVTFMLDSIAFWMREENNFSEMNAVIVNKGAIFAILTVRLSPITVSSNSSSNRLTHSNPEAVWNISASSGQGHLNGSWESDHAGPSAQDLEKVSTRSPFIDTIRNEITRAEALGQAVSTELDLMSNLITVARLAVEVGRAKEIYSYIRPDHTCTTVEPTPGNTEIDAQEVAESLLDLIEWEYQQLTQTGSFFCAQVLTKRRVSRSWQLRHITSVSWIQAGQTANMATS